MVVLAKDIHLVTLNIVFNSLYFLINVYGKKDVVNFRITKFHTCISANNILHTIRRVSVQQCAKECVSLSNCSAFNYRRFYKLCELHSTLHDISVGSEGSCVYIKRSDIFSQKSIPDCSQCANEGHSINKCCDRTYCPTLKLENGALLGNMHSVGSRIEYTCNEYFVEIGGETNSTCQTNGSWTHEPKCTNNFIYLGCYEDDEDRILYEENMLNSFLTTEICLNFCFDLDFEYALTQYQSQCFCGNTVRDYPKVGESECNTPCAGDPTDICGGTWRGSLYKRMQ